jgi:hypothetical protein
MTDQSAHFTGSIPANYDSGLGPHLFVDFAADLARRAAATNPGRVLEIAAGTGIVTRLLREALPSSTRLIASRSQSAHAGDRKAEIQRRRQDRIPAG